MKEELQDWGWRLPSGPPLYLRYASTEPLRVSSLPGDDQRGGAALARRSANPLADCVPSMLRRSGQGVRRPDRVVVALPVGGVGAAPL